MRWRVASLSIHRRQVLWAWSFLAVPVAFYVSFRIAPTLDTLWLSLTDWNLLSPPHFVGLRNFARLAADPVFWKVFRNTFAYLLIGTPVSLVLSFTIALQLDRTRFLHGLLRSLYFLPFLTTAVAMAWVWRWFYQPAPVGILNNMLTDLGLAQQPFLRSTQQALPAVLAPAVWAGLGFQVVIFLAGLRAIPATYYEAAAIDGVSGWTVLTEITLPLLKPTFVFLVVLSSIAFLRIFDQVYNMTSDDLGGPLNATKPLVLMIYQAAFNSFQMGYAAAQTLVLFLVLLGISLLQLHLLRGRG